VNIFYFYGAWILIGVQMVMEKQLNYYVPNEWFVDEQSFMLAK
jgi:hypothetical protein